MVGKHAACRTCANEGKIATYSPIHATWSCGAFPDQIQCLSPYTYCSIVLQTALEGQGVDLGWRHILAPLIEQGLLVRPLKESVSSYQPVYIMALGWLIPARRHASSGLADGRGEGGSKVMQIGCQLFTACLLSK